VLENLFPEDEEKSAYSDPDDGVKIVDMDEITHTDRLVPESLVKERNDWRRRRGIRAKNQKGKGMHPISSCMRSLCPTVIQSLNI
jgi:hypothetical protein